MSDENENENLAKGATLEEISMLLMANNKQLMEGLSPLLESLKPAKPKKGGDSEANPFQDALQARIEGEMADLDDAEKAFVAEFGGDDILAQSKALKALSVLKKSGKFKDTLESGSAPDSKDEKPGVPAEKPPAAPEVVTKPVRLNLSGSQAKEDPTSFKEAALRVQEAARQLRR